MVSGTQIAEAAGRIRGIAHRTPVLTSRTVDERTGSQVFFKCENFRRGGAFKIRGAANLIYSLSPEEVGKGVVAFSSGNHAQAVAIAAKSVGASATIAMPLDAPQSKVEATRGYGASIVTYDRDKDDREALGVRLAQETGAILVPPFDHELIIAGQGTAARELFEEVPDLDALVACIGGGGLLAGCASAAKAYNPAIRVFGVEPEQANDTWLSFREGRRVSIPPPNTIADGLRPPQPGRLTFPIIQSLVEDIVLVSENEIKEAMLLLLMRMKILVEPSGAVSAAAVLFGKLPPGLRRIGIILSGGNVDHAVLASLDIKQLA
jgi:threonine dehydratase